MNVVTTEDVVRSLIYDEHRDVVICQYELKITESGRRDLLKQALRVAGSACLADHRVQSRFFKDLEPKLSDAAFESTEDITTILFEFENNTYRFVDIVAPGTSRENPFFQWVIRKIGHN